MTPRGADPTALERPAPDLTAAHLTRVRVCQREALAEDIVALQLQAVDGRPLPAFEPGAHVDLHLPNGLVRPYSLCHAPRADGVYRVAVLREVAGRGGSACVHAQLVAGSELAISAPRNRFALASTPHALLLAGGIGITPLLAMAEDLAARGASFELHACARSRARAAFFQALQAVPWRGHVHWHLDDGPPAQRLQLGPLLQGQPAGTQVWSCGPAGFMDHVRQACTQAGWRPERLHEERFQAPAADDHGAPRPAEAGFEVVWAPTGQRLRVPAGRSVAAVLREAGLPVALSCEQGLCGSCVLRVLQGQPDHRDNFFSAAEQAANDRFTPCCSRARSAALVVAPP